MPPIVILAKLTGQQIEGQAWLKENKQGFHKGGHKLFQFPKS